MDAGLRARSYGRSVWRFPDAIVLWCDDGQPDLPSGGHAELPSGGQLDYLV
jgi:hypothetical protein